MHHRFSSQIYNVLQINRTHIHTFATEMIYNNYNSKFVTSCMLLSCRILTKKRERPGKESNQRLVKFTLYIENVRDRSMHCNVREDEML